MKRASVCALMLLTGCVSPPSDRESNTSTIVWCIFAQCLVNETTKAANQEEVSGALTHSEMQAIEQESEAEIEADLKP